MRAASPSSSRVAPFLHVEWRQTPEEAWEESPLSQIGEGKGRSRLSPARCTRRREAPKRLLAAACDASRGASGDSARSHHGCLLLACGCRLGAGFDGVQLLGLLPADQADLDQVKRADEAVADAEPAGASDR